MSDELTIQHSVFEYLNSLSHVRCHFCECFLTHNEEEMSDELPICNMCMALLSCGQISEDDSVPGVDWRREGF